MNNEKVTWMKQNNMISDEKSFASKLCATENEHTHLTVLKKKIKIMTRKRRTMINGSNLISACQ